MAASEKLRKAGAAFNVLVVLTEESAARGGELYRWFLKEGFPDVQFIPCVEPGPGGRPADFSVTAETYGRFLVESFEEWRSSGYPRGASERTFMALLAHHAGEDPGLCTLGAECASYLVVERAGDVYPCDFFVAPEWKLGRVGESPLAEMARSELRGRFTKLKSAARERCGDCPWWDLCHGGCPKDRMAVGDIAAPTPLCAAYRKLFEASVDWFRAEGVRLAERCRRQREVQAAAETMRKRAAAPAPPKMPPPSRNDPCPCGSGKKFKRCCGK
jgi:uncharacterized protein